MELPTVTIVFCILFQKTWGIPTTINHFPSILSDPYEYSAYQQTDNDDNLDFLDSSQNVEINLGDLNEISEILPDFGKYEVLLADTKDHAFLPNVFYVPTNFDQSIDNFYKRKDTQSESNKANTITKLLIMEPDIKTTQDYDTEQIAKFLLQHFQLEIDREPETNVYDIKADYDYPSYNFDFETNNKSTSTKDHNESAQYGLKSDLEYPLEDYSYETVIEITSTENQKETAQYGLKTDLEYPLKDYNSETVIETTSIKNHNETAQYGLTTDLEYPLRDFYSETVAETVSTENHNETDQYGQKTDSYNLQTNNETSSENHNETSRYGLKTDQHYPLNSYNLETNNETSTENHNKTTQYDLKSDLEYSLEDYYSETVIETTSIKNHNETAQYGLKTDLKYSLEDYHSETVTETTSTKNHNETAQYSLKTDLIETNNKTTSTENHNETAPYDLGTDLQYLLNNYDFETNNETTSTEGYNATAQYSLETDLQYPLNNYSFEANNKTTPIEVLNQTARHDLETDLTHVEYTTHIDPKPSVTTSPSQPTKINTESSTNASPKYVFDPRSDAGTLYKALNSYNANSTIIIKVLTRRSSVQRLEIAKQFQLIYGKDLAREFKNKLRGHFKTLIEALMTPLEQYYANELHYAMKGPGTDEDCLIEILSTLNNNEIKTVRNIYENSYGRTLQSDIRSDTSGNFEELLISLSNAIRDESGNVNQRVALEDANRLLKAGVLKWGTDESTFISILTERNYNQLQIIFDAYENLAHHNIEYAIKKEFSKFIKRGLLAIVHTVDNRSDYFAQRLHASIAGWGTNERALIRIIVTRNEIDMKLIKSYYAERYGSSLEKDIGDDTSGDFKKCLLALIKDY